MSRFDQEHLEHPVSPAHPDIAAPLSSLCHPGSSSLIDGHFERSSIEMQGYRWNGNESTKGGRSRVIIDMLPDVALLRIFDFYVGGARMAPWYTLVHVCRKWRTIVFGSPRRLNLRLRCSARTPVRETIDAWPLLPIVVLGYGHATWGVDNIIAAVGHNDRICKLDLLGVPYSQMENVFAAMQQPFPALEDLRLYLESETEVVPASFLGGSAPRLQSLYLDRIPFPGLPKLLLSATHLVSLNLANIPHSGYFSPEAMATGLSALTSLETLIVEFESPRSRPDPPLTRTLLPVLIDFVFKGVSEYLDDLVARIDAPLLNELQITFFYQLIFDTPQLTQFISRTPNFNPCDHALVQFCNWGVRVSIDSALRMKIPCLQSEWQLSCLAQVCGSIFIPQLNASTFGRSHVIHRFGKTTSRLANGWNFYIDLPL